VRAFDKRLSCFVGCVNFVNDVGGGIDKANSLKTLEHSNGRKQVEIGCFVENAQARVLEQDGNRLACHQILRHSIIGCHEINNGQLFFGIADQGDDFGIREADGRADSVAAFSTWDQHYSQVLRSLRCRSNDPGQSATSKRDLGSSDGAAIGGKPGTPALSSNSAKTIG
jgi:hypothetical protein